MRISAETKALMFSGAMYDDLTSELVEARAEAVRLSNAYNATWGQSQEMRDEALRRLVRSIGPGSLFEPVLRVEFGENITIGRNFFANFDCVILDGAEVTIGDYVLFGPRVGIYTSNHAIDAEERAAGACYAKPVTIGNRVWVGGGVNINQGVTIGDHSIIGAGSVVTKDVPPNVIAAGVPCRVIRSITEADRTGFKSA
ncbi:sugar O-acetyltransferase [Methylobacterium sp. 37f]|uniref:sugar O-acetyltransferase n=1 Tax=Methylobacterium sp. 37f TaxID=2817058 RepID=UPI001FFDAF7F|nr:sugar O-acetyltransferase [Methylobacterium sp. 37f]